MMNFQLCSSLTLAAFCQISESVINLELSLCNKSNTVTGIQLTDMTKKVALRIIYFYHLCLLVIVHISNRSTSLKSGKFQLYHSVSTSVQSQLLGSAIYHGPQAVSWTIQETAKPVVRSMF